MNEDSVKIRRTKIHELFAEAKSHGRPLYVSAPMVRYSKLPFRLLVREYGTDVIYTPMMLAHEFIRSQHARDSDFTTCQIERQETPDGKKHALIAQFASSDPVEFARASALIEPWVDGVNLNCGCPQSWAIKEGIGCSLMTSPELVAAMVRAAKERLPASCSVSVKIRISKNLEETKHWIRIVEDAGVDYITIHGRTRSQRSSTPPNFDAVRTLKAMAKVPITLNGDVYSLDDAHRLAKYTGVDGIMAARGLLENPALFAGHSTASIDLIRLFLRYAISSPIPFALVQHHINDMATNMKASKAIKQKMQNCRDLVELIDFVEFAWPQLESSRLEAG